MVDLLQWNHIIKWRPQIGDTVLFSGWFTKWCGVVSAINRTEVEVVKAGTITELVQLGTKEQKDRTIALDVEAIKRSKSKYSIMQVQNNIGVWFV